MTTNSKNWFTYHGLNIPNGWAGIPPHLIPPIDFSKAFVNKKLSGAIRATCQTCGESIVQPVEFDQGNYFTAPGPCPNCKDKKTLWNVTFIQTGML